VEKTIGHDDVRLSRKILLGRDGNLLDHLSPRPGSQTMVTAESEVARVGRRTKAHARPRQGALLPDCACPGGAGIGEQTM
jgi:hypothetical protein